jgi:hypothetical protein
MPEIRLIDLRGGQARTVQRIRPLPEDPNARADLTRKPSTTMAEWRALSRDHDFRVRYAVATSPLCPAPILSLMVVDAHPYVRAAVANNPHTPAAALKALAKDSVSDVRAVARAALEARAAELSR